MRRTLIVAVVGAVVLVLGTIVLVVPWQGKDRDPVTGTPVASAFSTVTPLPLSPRATACLTDVALDVGTSTAVLSTAPKSPRSGPPLRVTATGPGYRSTGMVAPGYGAEVGITAPLRTPARSLLVRLCVRNVGTRTVLLGGSRELRTTSRPQLSVNGRQDRTQLGLRLSGSRPRTVGGDLGTVLRHVAAFKPWPFHRLLLGLLLVLVIAGVPVGVWLAMTSAARLDDEDFARPPAGELEPPDPGGG